MAMNGAELWYDALDEFDAVVGAAADAVGHRFRSVLIYAL